MNLSPAMQKIFVDELNLIVAKMRESDSPKDKVYFFSAAYAMAQRVINIEYNPELNFIQQVLQNAYETIYKRVNMISSSQQTNIPVIDNMFVRIEEELEEMVKSIEEGKETYSHLQTILNLSYSTTGNGYYLYLKGMLKV